MNYTKPEVAVLGDAIASIEHITQKGGRSIEGPGPNGPLTAVAPAYDLDE